MSPSSIYNNAPFRGAQHGETMKTLADFKRALSLGSKWKLQNHLFNFEREQVVTATFSNQVQFTTNNNTVSGLYFPKARNIKCNDNTVLVFNDAGTHVLTYTKL